jgi:prolyl oligopeptidase
MRYPVAERAPVVDALHTHLVPDPYRWLEDPNSPQTLDWRREQEELWRACAAELPARDWFQERVAALSDVDTDEALAWRGEHRFWLSRTAGQEHAVLRTEARVLVDPIAIDPTGLTTLDAWHPNHDGRRLAYQLSRHGTERAELFVLEVATGSVIDGPIDRCRYSPVAWLPGGEAFYYVRLLPAGFARRVYLHRIGTSADEDVPVTDEGTGFGLGISADGRWLVVSESLGAGNDLRIADLTAGVERPEFRTVHCDLSRQAVADVGPDGRLYVLTNVDAPNHRLCVAYPDQPDAPGWRDLIPEDPGATLTGFTMLDDLLLVTRLRHGISEMTIHDLATGLPRGEVPLPGAGSVGRLAVRGSEAWFTYTDSVTPPTVYRFDARTGKCAAGGEPRGAVNGPTSHTLDGGPVRITVLAGDGAGPRPLILYGYGGFGLPLTPTYSAFILAWVQAGGVFALAHLPYEGRKQRAVEDFVAAADYLVAQGWTAPDRLAACGESNGGLIVGAALTRRPDLFAAAACSAPLLDMVRYERSGMGAAWRSEYGSASDPEQLDGLLGYSPYHHVRAAVDYPAVLFTVFDGDTRVDPMHARKMCAALQWATSSTRPIVLREESGVGHGARAASRGIALAGDMLAFLAAQTGLSPW